MHPIGIPCTRDCSRTGRKDTRTADSLSRKNFGFIKDNRLAGSLGDLGGSPLSTLLADLSSCGRALSGSGALGLLGLLGGGAGGLLLLALLDGGGASGVAGLGALGALLLDHIEGSTDDATLGLDGAAGSLLGNLLYLVSVVFSPSNKRELCHLLPKHWKPPGVWRYWQTLGLGGYRGASIVPQRYPCGAGGGTGQSRRCGGGSFFAGRETRTCRSGIGRPCCRHGRRFYPETITSQLLQSIHQTFPRGSGQASLSFPCWPRFYIQGPPSHGRGSQFAGRQ